MLLLSLYKHPIAIAWVTGHNPWRRTTSMPPSLLSTVFPRQHRIVRTFRMSHAPTRHSPREISELPLSCKDFFLDEWLECHRFASLPTLANKRTRRTEIADDVKTCHNTCAFFLSRARDEHHMEDRRFTHLLVPWHNKIEPLLISLQQVSLFQFSHYSHSSKTSTCSRTPSSLS